MSPKTAAASSSSGKSRARKPKGQRVKFLKEFLANPTKIGAVAPSGKLLSRNLAIYGLGGVIVPFIGIKAIDMAVAALGLA